MEKAIINKESKIIKSKVLNKRNFGAVLYLILMSGLFFINNDISLLGLVLFAYKKLL